MISVMVVEDQAMPRRLFEIWIQESGRYCLAWSIENAAMAEIYCMKGGIDLIIMDVCTALGESGLEAAARIKQKYPGIRIIIVTSMPECTFIEKARRAGVDSFWYKEISREPLLSVMDRTMAGESVFPSAAPVLQIGAAASSDFSERELEVLRELTGGDPDEVIALHLHMSVWTVRSHIRHLLEKTGFDSRTRLAVAVRECGLVIRGY